MRFMVTLVVDVPLDGWKDEYGVSYGESVTQILSDLREPGWYLTGEKWSGLATLAKVSAVLDLSQDPDKLF